MNLVATIAVGFVLASIFGYVADRLRLPALVGFVVAGIFIGPFTPGFVADTAMAGQLAEIGIILLMFGVGLHFSASDLLAVRGVVLPGALGQIVLATLLGAGLCWMWGWDLGHGIVLGLCVSVASTVVLLKALEERNLVEIGARARRDRMADRRGPCHGPGAGAAAGLRSDAGRARGRRPRNIRRSDLAGAAAHASPRSAASRCWRR